MALFNTPSTEKKHTGFLHSVQADIIKWEPEFGMEAELIAHKFEYQDFPNGSQLIVGPSQMAVFVNNMDVGGSGVDGGAGEAQVSTFIGPCRIKLETGNSRFEPFRKIKNALTGGDSGYHCTVYFINTTYMTDLNWGTQDPIVVQDPVEEVNVHVRAHGLFGVHIEHDDEGMSRVYAQKFLRKVVGTKADFSKEDLIAFMRAKILEYVPTLLAKNMVDQQVGVLTISTKLEEFSQAIQGRLVEPFSEFGITLDNFSFHNINVPDSDIAAINEMKIAKKMRHLEAEANADAMDIESAAEARKREREGYTYQQEKGFDVMRDAAQNQGTASTLMGAGMGLGMGFGIGGAMNTGFSNIAQGTLGAMGQPMMGQPMMAQATPVQPQAGQIQCPNCQNILIATAKFCNKCGTKMAPPAEDSFCIECGAKVPAGSKFCLECGTPVQ